MRCWWSALPAAAKIIYSLLALWILFLGAYVCVASRPDSPTDDPGYIEPHQTEKRRP